VKHTSIHVASAASRAGPRPAQGRANTPHPTHSLWHPRLRGLAVAFRSAHNTSGSIAMPPKEPAECLQMINSQWMRGWMRDYEVKGKKYGAVPLPVLQERFDIFWQMHPAFLNLARLRRCVQCWRSVCVKGYDTGPGAPPQLQHINHKPFNRCGASPSPSDVSKLYARIVSGGWSLHEPHGQVRVFAVAPANKGVTQSGCHYYCF